MALALKLCKLSRQSLLKNKGYLYNVARCSSDDTPLPWNYHWQPSKYSKEKHNEIAEKYYLHPKDYKPYPKDMAMGDYPDLPKKGPACRDPYYPYDIPAFKKNYHEPVHYQYGIMTEDRFDFGEVHRIDLGVGILIFVAVISGLAVLYIIADSYYTFQPLMEKQYPYTDKVHYTFEPEKNEV